MKRRPTYRRIARQRWPGSPVRGAGPFAVLEPWPDSQSGWSVSLWYSERRARELADSIGLAYEFEHGGFTPAPVYDLTQWSREP